jgi:hypothetical protein
MSPSNLIARTAPLPMALACAVLPVVADSASAVAQVGMGILRLPFDAARAQYARGVQVGLIERSILASRDFECALGALERLTLGPLARRV